MRGRLLLTSDGAGEFCLRPEFTIPVSLAYLASPQAGARRRLLLLWPGVPPASRRRAGIPAGRARKFRPRRPRSRRRRNPGAGAGDGARLRRDWRITHRRRRPSDRAAGKAGPAAGLAAPHPERPRQGPDACRNPRPRRRRQADHSGVLAALDGADKPGARAWSRICSKIAGISALGGRTAGEIAERFLEQAELRSGAGLDDDKRELLREILRHRRPARTRPRRNCARCSRRRRLDLDARTRRLRPAPQFLAARGLDMDKIAFSASFARNLDYYTGFVFEAFEAGATSRRSRRSAAGAMTGCCPRSAPRPTFPPSAPRSGSTASSQSESRSAGMSEPKLVLAVPSKGRLQENANAFFARAGLTVTQGRGARDYRGVLVGRRQCRSRLSLGLGNRRESGFGRRAFRRHRRGSGARGQAEGKVELLTPLGFGHANVVVAAPQAWIDVRDHGRSRRRRRELSRPARRAHARRDQIRQHHPRASSATRASPTTTSSKASAPPRARPPPDRPN